MSKLTPEAAADRLATAVNNVERAMRAVVKAAEPELLDQEALQKIEAFVTNRTGDMVRDLGLLMASKGRGKTFSLDAPLETYEAPRSVLSTWRPGMGGVAAAPPPALPVFQSPEALHAYEQRRQLGGRLVGTPKTISTAIGEDDEDGVGFIDED